MAGDFNQDLLLAGHHYGSSLGREALRAALTSAGLECLTGGTDDPISGPQCLASIDHICVGELLALGRPRSSAWPTPGDLPRGLTDHYGVWVDIEAPSPGPRRRCEDRGEHQAGTAPP